MRRWWNEGTGILITAGALAVTGCGGSSSLRTTQKPITPAATGMQGAAFGGQQAITGMSVQMYAVGGSGYGSAATAVLGTPLITNSNGQFTFPANWYDGCPSGGSLVYLVGTGGVPLAGNTGGVANSRLALMVALGTCSSLETGTHHVHMNELTTVAAVWALAPFMTGTTNSYLTIGSPSLTNATGMTLAFGAANEVVNTDTGTFPGTLPTGATLPTTELYSIANILEACINSTGGAANDGSACGNLFRDASAGSNYPTDTITAATNIAQNPARNVTPLFNDAEAQPAFQVPLGSAPNAWTVAIQYTGGGLNAPTTVAADQSGNIWVGNSGSGAVSRFDNLGNAQTPTSLGGIPAGIAIDLTGNAWVTASNNDVYELDKTTGDITGTTPFTGFSTPTGVAVDPAGYIWVVNNGNNSVSAFNSSGTSLLNGPFTSTSLSSPGSIAINGNANANCADCH